MKAIIVAGGHGSRLLPMTAHTHKTLLPLCGRPVIDYALATIRSSGIEDISIIGNRFIDKIRNHVGDDVTYFLEDEPRGVGQAIELAREGNEGCALMIWFADNITNLDLKNEVDLFEEGCTLLTRKVEDPSAFGIAIMEGDTIVGVEEKPSEDFGNTAIGGIYLFDSTFWNRFDNVKDKPDFSISDVTRQYIEDGVARTIGVGENTWIDCGTFDGLHRAAQMVDAGLFTIRGL